jgi:hypothetical protein
MKADYDATLGPNGEIPAVPSPVAPQTPVCLLQPLSDADLTLAQVVAAAKAPKAVKSAPVVPPQAESSDEGSEEESSEVRIPPRLGAVNGAQVLQQDDDDEEEEEEQPAHKKHKVAAAPPPPVVVPEKKGKGKAPREKKPKKA